MRTFTALNAKVEGNARQTFKVIFADRGPVQPVVKHGEPLSCNVLCFIFHKPVDLLLAWFAGSGFPAWQPTLLHLRNHLSAHRLRVGYSSKPFFRFVGADAPDYGTGQPVRLWVSSHGQRSQRALISGRVRVPPLAANKFSVG